MSKKNFSYKNVLDLLIKKATGFYYNEEQYEYEKTQNKSLLNKNKTLNVNNCEQLTIFNNHQNICNEQRNPEDKNNQNLTLIKKKVTTHYISPDMVAIKILLEIYNEKMKDDLSNLTDSELLELKNTLLKEIQNEDN